MRKRKKYFSLILFFCAGLAGRVFALGDANSDGSVTIVDSLATAQYSVGLNVPDFNVEEADVNCDGKIDIVDALTIAQYTVGLITRFPCAINSPDLTDTDHDGIIDAVENLTGYDPLDAASAPAVAVPDKWYVDPAGDETVTYNFRVIPGYILSPPVVITLEAGTYLGIDGKPLAPVIFIPAGNPVPFSPVGYTVHNYFRVLGRMTDGHTLSVTLPLPDNMSDSVPVPRLFEADPDNPPADYAEYWKEITGAQAARHAVMFAVEPPALVSLSVRRELFPMKVIPVHAFHWDSGLDQFAVEETELINAEWVRVMTGAYPSDTAAITSGRSYDRSQAGWDYPVTLVNFIDAVLYCNARSREDGLQQVYIFRDAGSNVLNGSGAGGQLLDRQYITGNIGNGPMLADGVTLTIRYDNYGYRLPDTDEWAFAETLGRDEYAAPGFFFPQNARRDLPAERFVVFQDGSRKKALRAAGRFPTNFGLFDVLGNAAELVQDFDHTTGEITRIIVKGGSWNQPLRDFQYAAQVSSGFADRETGFRIILPTIRRNAARLSRQEKERLLKGLFTLKNLEAPYYIPSLKDRTWDAGANKEKGNLNWYDWFALSHSLVRYFEYNDEGTWKRIGDAAHNTGQPTSHFLPWHREFLNLMEYTLQTTVDYRITIPYIGWAYGSTLFNEDGSVRTQARAENEVTEVMQVFNPGENRGLLGFVAGDAHYRGDNGGIFDPDFPAVSPALPGWWPYIDSKPVAGWFVHETLGYGVTSPFLVRMNWAGAADTHSSDVGEAMEQPAYMDFSTILERIPHGSFHSHMGGQMGDMRAPEDPVFYLHHSEIDHLWEVWRRKDIARQDPDANGYADQVENYPLTSLDKYLSIAAGDAVRIVAASDPDTAAVSNGIIITDNMLPKLYEPVRFRDVLAGKGPHYQAY